MIKAIGFDNCVVQGSRLSFQIVAGIVALVGSTPVLGQYKEVRDAGKWIYRHEVDSIRPISRAFELLSEKPQDVIEHVFYKGSRQQYAQLRYGSENSTRVTVVVDSMTDGNVNFYIDSNRDREITNDESIAGSGISRTCAITAEIIEEDRPLGELRKIQLSVSATKDRLNVATLGCIEGSLNIARADDHPIIRTVRRLDGDANGLFSDSKDRLLIDLDNNGKFEFITEQFALLPILMLNDVRHSVHTDRFGTRLSLSEVKGVGRLRIIADRLSDSASVTAFEGMIFGEDGSAYSVRQLDEPIQVPVGRYALGSVTMTIDDGQELPWHFVFSRYKNVSSEAWISVEADAEVSVEAIGIPRFIVETNTTDAINPGSSFVVSPRLFTEGELLINLCSRGKQIGSFDDERRHQLCRVDLTNASGATIVSATSGFR